LPAFIFDTALTRKAVGIVSTASQALILDATLTVFTLSILTATLLAAVFKADLTARTGVIIRAASDALAVAAKGAFATGHDVIVPATARLAVVGFTDRAHATVLIITAGRSAEVVNAALSRAAVGVVSTITTGALIFDAELSVAAALIISAPRNTGVTGADLPLSAARIVSAALGAALLHTDQP
jgi:hypothetical protein